MAIYLPTPHPRTVIGGIEDHGAILACERNHATGVLKRVVVAMGIADDHNVPAIWAKDGRRSVLMWTQHNVDNVIRARVSDTLGSVESFATATHQTFTASGDGISYTQIVHRPAASTATVDAFWLFSRRTQYLQEIIPFTINQATGTITWGTEQLVFRSYGSGGDSRQLYIAVADDYAELTTPGANQRIRCALFHNPADDELDGYDHAVWYFEIDCVTGDVTSPDNPGLTGNVLTGANLPINMPPAVPRIADTAGSSRRVFGVRPGPDAPAIALAEWPLADTSSATYRVHECADRAPGDPYVWSDRFYGASGAAFGYSYYAGLAFDKPSHNKRLFKAATDGTTDTLVRYDRDSEDVDTPTTLVTQPISSGRLARPYPPYAPYGAPPYDVLFNNITHYPAYTDYLMSGEAI
jgi:hypothetical protein